MDCESTAQSGVGKWLGWWFARAAFHAAASHQVHHNNAGVSTECVRGCGAGRPGMPSHAVVTANRNATRSGHEPRRALRALCQASAAGEALGGVGGRGDAPVVVDIVERKPSGLYLATSAFCGGECGTDSTVCLGNEGRTVGAQRRSCSIRNRCGSGTERRNWMRASPLIQRRRTLVSASCHISTNRCISLARGRNTDHVLRRRDRPLDLAEVGGLDWDLPAERRHISRCRQALLRRGEIRRRFRRCPQVGMRNKDSGGDVIQAGWFLRDGRLGQMRATYRAVLLAAGNESALLVPNCVAVVVGDTVPAGGEGVRTFVPA